MLLSRVFLAVHKLESLGERIKSINSGIFRSPCRGAFPDNDFSKVIINEMRNAF